jgi:hypothetical protein
VHAVAAWIEAAGEATDRAALARRVEPFEDEGDRPSLRAACVAQARLEVQQLELQPIEMVVVLAAIEDAVNGLEVVERRRLARAERLGRATPAQCFPTAMAMPFRSERM